MAQENWNCDTADGQGCQQKQEGPAHCTNNCGLLGSAATMNLCSKCFGELRLKQQGIVDEAAIVMASATDEKPVFSEKSLVFIDKSFVSMSQEKHTENKSDKSVIPPPRSTEVAALGICSSPLTHVGAVKSSDLAALLSPHTKQQSAAASSRHSSHKCFMCRKRTGLLGFKCRCGNVFCAPHRYSDKHNCPFDYKAAARVAISKANPVVKAPKVEKI